ncbi:MAG: hypothetical protein ACM3UP_02405 [Methanocella sp.]
MAIVTVLLVLAIMLALGAASLYITNDAAHGQRFRYFSAQALFAAEGGANRAIGLLARDGVKLADAITAARNAKALLDQPLDNSVPATDLAKAEVLADAVIEKVSTDPANFDYAVYARGRAWKIGWSASGVPRFKVQRFLRVYVTFANAGGGDAPTFVVQDWQEITADQVASHAAALPAGDPNKAVYQAWVQ